MTVNSTIGRGINEIFINAGKRHFWKNCPCRYLPVNTGGKYRQLMLPANPACICKVRPPALIGYYRL